MMEIKGYVEHIVFRNEDNGYTVMNVETEEDEILCVGIFPTVSEGMYLLLHGEMQEHPRYGEQLRVSSYEEQEPEDERAVMRYLASGAIKGIGPALAERIIKKFKEDTLRIIEEEPERLAEIKGISLKKAIDISVQMEEKREQRQVMIFLQKYGVSANLSVKIYQQYGSAVFSILKENPYRLANDIEGIGFKTADEIAAKAGIQANSDFRIRSGLLYELYEATAEGHTYLPKELLRSRTAHLLQIEEEYIEKHFMDLAMEQKLILKEKDGQVIVFASSYYYMEVNVAAMLANLDLEYDVAPKILEEHIKRIEARNQIELDELQREAVKGAVCNGLFVLTGGPGTGKTTTINSIIQYFELEGLDIALAAPTGRAAKRMSEATGYDAKTIHRLLELNGGVEGNVAFERNAENPLEADVVIIDEMSMVDISLMNSLLKAIVPGTRLILVGDANQLPSVKAGSVLRDMIQSNCYTTVSLNRIFRQAGDSDIVVNAHKIQRGEKVVADNKSKDFFFLKRYAAEQIANVVTLLVRDKLPGYVDSTSFDIQVLTPMRKGPIGVEQMNKVLQYYLNPPDESKIEKEIGSRLFREGDKVMQIKNNYQLEWRKLNKYNIETECGMGVFNGDMGIVKRINDFASTVTIAFEENRIVEYAFKDLDELELAYAITIHKSQGSEYPAVVIPLLSGPRMLMNRNLIYTAITRAKQCVTIVGDENVFDEMVANNTEQVRYTALKDRIHEIQGCG